MDATKGMVETGGDHVYVNLFHSSGQLLIAACDKEILGKTFRSGRLKLEIKESFYKGNLRSLDEVIQMIDTADVVNLAGNRIVQAAIESGHADPEAVILIGGTRHLQIMRL